MAQESDRLKTMLAVAPIYTNQAQVTREGSAMRVAFFDENPDATNLKGNFVMNIEMAAALAEVLQKMLGGPPPTKIN